MTESNAHEFTRAVVQGKNPDLVKMYERIDRAQKSGHKYRLIVAEAFIRGIRDLGYKSTATALDELLDNSIQADAQNVHVVIDFSGKAKGDLNDRLAVIDDGHGMPAGMIPISAEWGGTHRENDRSGFGRYGYGEPSSCVSQGRRFTVYSMVEGNAWYRLVVDLDRIAAGDYTDPEGDITLPQAEPAHLPGWITAYIKEHLPGGELHHGTVVVIEKLDKLTWVTPNALERNLKQHFAVVYRNWMRNTKIFVNGERVEPIDPLFITPGFRFYDSYPDPKDGKKTILDPDRATGLEPTLVTVKDRETGKELGTIKVRYSYMPPSFGRMPDSKLVVKNPKMNPRFTIMKEHNGLIVLRNGRQIDVVTKFPDSWNLALQNNDRWWMVEIDFPPSLDEDFSVTTSKQQIGLSERIWTNLRDAGVRKTIAELRKKHEADEQELAEESEEEEIKTSEQVMGEILKFKTEKPVLTPEKIEQIEDRFEEEIRRRLRETRAPEDIVRRELEFEIQGHPYKVELESLPGAPLYRAEQLGSQVLLRLNTAHRFYQDVYRGPDTTPRLRAALELLLFVLSEAELDSADERQMFYQSERMVWSQRLNQALDRLNQKHSVEDAWSRAEASQEDADWAANLANGKPEAEDVDSDRAKVRFNQELTSALGE